MNNAIAASLAVSFACAALVGTGADGLLDGFRNPPHAAKPHTWYHLIDGNVSKEGITADFEALADIGIGGVHMFDAGLDMPTGKVDFASDEWFDILKHAAQESKRLGLEIVVPNCSGWSSSGGPWNTPSNAMKEVVFSVGRVKGPVSSFSLDRPGDPKLTQKAYGDVAVLAWPVPKAELSSFAEPKDERAENVATLTYPEPVETSGFSYRINHVWTWTATVRLEIQASDDGVAYRSLDAFDEIIAKSGTSDPEIRFHAFPKRVRARHFRLVLTTPYRFRHENPQAKIGEFRMEKTMRIADLKAKRFAIRLEAPRTVAETTPDQVVNVSAVRDLTASLRPDGTVAAALPEGEWRVMRVGWTYLDWCNGPATKCGLGLEVDKLDGRTLDYHFEQYIARLCRTLGPDLVGHDDYGLNATLVDSYEVGAQTWTPRLPDEFRRRRGYDIRPFLPALVGAVVDSVDRTEDFLYDYRRTIAEMFAENYGGALRRNCRKYGIRLYLEPYGNCPADNLEYGYYADVPMGEVWSVGGDRALHGGPGNGRLAAHLAHVWGHPFAAMESFTGYPAGVMARWQTTPYALKPQNDRLFTAGINRIVFHRFVHQPWGKNGPVPGMTMRDIGMHFDRTQTWWEEGREFVRYQTRCQYLLQAGRFCADALVFTGDDVPNQGGNTDGGSKYPFSMAYGYDWDLANPRAVAALRVENGEIVVPGGVRYAFLVVPPDVLVNPETRAVLDRLRAAGATVCADADAEAKRRGLPPQFGCDANRAEDRVSWIHRRTDEGDDIFFVACANRDDETFNARFRVTGRRPEVWNPQTGECALASDWQEENGMTRVRLTVDPSGSRFVVFRRKPTAGLAVETSRKTVATRDLSADWTVTFPNGFRPNAVAEGTPERLAFPNLCDWTHRQERGVQYFSGSAVYEKEIDLAGLDLKNRRVTVDLGTVRDFATVTVNGRTFPALWKDPYAVDVTEAVGKDGKVKLSVKVTNRWMNRLMGEEKFLEPDCEWNKNRLVEFPKWFREGKKSPTGRSTFTTFRHWGKDDTPFSSGLLGPARLLVEEVK